MRPDWDTAHLGRGNADTTPLPAAALTALRAIRSDLRNLPRDCIVDRAELLHWLNRMARRVEGVEQIRVPIGSSPPPRPATLLRPTTSNAEAVFGSSSTAPKRQPARTITSRKGKVVRVETRQLQLFGADCR